MLQEKKVIYRCQGLEFHGFLVYDSTVKEKRPAVIVAHAWRGQDSFAKQKARQLASWGYAGFAADVYGKGISVESNEEAQGLMIPLFIDRHALRERIVAAYQAVAKEEVVDSKQIGAIGFCFGGLTVIELLRSGAPVRGVVSLHGVLGDALGEAVAKREPNAPALKGEILILHGHDDPLVTPFDVEALQNELTEAKVTWQMNIYGHIKHAFTNPDAHDEKLGLVYNAKMSERAMRSARNFLSDIFC